MQAYPPARPLPPAAMDDDDDDLPPHLRAAPGNYPPPPGGYQFPRPARGHAARHPARGLATAGRPGRAELRPAAGRGLRQPRARALSAGLSPRLPAARLRTRSGRQRPAGKLWRRTGLSAGAGRRAAAVWRPSGLWRTASLRRAARLSGSAGTRADADRAGPGARPPGDVAGRDPTGSVRPNTVATLPPEDQPEQRQGELPPHLKRQLVQLPVDPSRPARS